MTYKNIADLPESVQDNLPEHAQEIYQSAYNSAWDQYDDPTERRDGRDRDETAHAVAWNAVKQKYEKDEQSGKWHEK
jgi:cation transport regulator